MGASNETSAKINAGNFMMGNDPVGPVGFVGGEKRNYLIARLQAQTLNGTVTVCKRFRMIVSNAMHLSLELSMIVL